VRGEIEHYLAVRTVSTDPLTGLLFGTALLFCSNVLFWVFPWFQGSIEGNLPLDRLPGNNAVRRVGRYQAIAAPVFVCAIGVACILATVGRVTQRSGALLLPIGGGVLLLALILYRLGSFFQRTRFRFEAAQTGIRQLVFVAGPVLMSLNGLVCVVAGIVRAVSGHF
jgi:hypothetical protein